MFQQGDVILKKTDKELKGMLRTTNILKQGDNNHILEGGAKIYDGEEGVLVNVYGPCNLVHTDKIHGHDPISLPLGLYELTTVKEYDHFTEEAKEVID